MPFNLDDIPKGTWLKRKNDTVIIGTSLRDNLSENLFVGLIVLTMTSLFLVVTISQIIQGETSIYFGGGIVLFCLYALSVFVSRALMSLFGQVEIRLDHTEGTVFYGIKRFGRTRTFTYEKTHTIESYTAMSSFDVPTQLGIKIKAEKTIILAGYLKQEKINFIIGILHLFLKDGEKIRDLLPLDLIHNLID